ncbi:Ribonuclease kappa [Gracilaria domingensis]|nr:Ribonuclease kappa [Gracilaria domingensis]
MNDPLPLEILSYLGSSASNLPKGVTLNTEVSSDNTALLTLQTDSQLSGDHIFSAKYDQLHTYISFTPSQSQSSGELSFLAFQTAEFALPIRASDTRLQFTYFSRPGFVRPHTFLPLFIFSKGACCLLAPLDTYHEQVLIADNAHLKWGWQGDLECLKPSFSSTLAIIVRSTTRAALQQWTTLLQCRGRLRSSLDRYSSVVLSHLTYWTDNGAAYWYRTEKGLSITASLEQTVRHIEQAQVPLAAVEIDSWFYPHEKTRNISDIGYLHIVPPTGMLRWEPRDDVFKDGGFQTLQKRLGNKPLIFHSRHISSKSPYISELKNERWWITDDRAHPQDDSLFRTWMSDAKRWGACAYEQDWMVEVWLGVRGLRAGAGRIFEWQKQLNDAAKGEGLHLIWCMSTPADMMTASNMEQVISIRSCDDYRYAEDPSILWRWHLVTSKMISALGFCPFKDVFMTHKNTSGKVDIDGDPNAELEACLAVMSAGPVGIGDRLGRTDRNIVSKCCRPDGLLIKPDLPITAMEYSMRNGDGFLWGATHSSAWKYILVVRTGMKACLDETQDIPAQEVLRFADGRKRVIYDWRENTVSTSSCLRASLKVHEWKFWVVCPVWKRGDGGDETYHSVIGDTSKFASVGDKRFGFEHKFTAQQEDDEVQVHVNKASDSDSESTGTWTACENFNDGIELNVMGVSGERIDVVYWSEHEGMLSKVVEIPETGRQCLRMVCNDNKNTTSVELI